nr:MAG TPA: hypothetical protein [Caudoviricetes sp.]
MLIPTVKAKEFEKFGFKKCKGSSDLECYYLCVARGKKMLFVSNVYFEVNAWSDDDPRIHANPNCRYRSGKTSLDIVYELIKAGMLKSNFEKEKEGDTDGEEGAGAIHRRVRADQGDRKGY